MQKLSKNIHYEGTSEMNSSNEFLQQGSAPSHTARNTISYCRESHLCRTCDVASKQSDLNLVDHAVWAAMQQRVYIAITVWNNGTVETGNRKWVGHSVSEVHWSQYQWMATTSECVVQQNGRHTEHLFEQFFSRRLYTDFCHSLCTFVNYMYIASLIFRTSSTLHACC